MARRARIARHRSFARRRFHGVHLHETVVLVLEQLADFPFAQLIEHVLLPSVLVALQLPPSGPGAEILLLSLAATFAVAAGAGFLDGTAC